MSTQPGDRTPPRQSEKDLLQDFQTVRAVENSPARQEILRDTLFYQSTPQAVEDWYFGQDSIAEVYFTDLRHSLETDFDNTILREIAHAYALGNGGAVLIASVAFPELFQDEETGKGWRQRLDERFDTHYRPLDTTIHNPEAPLEVTGIIEFAYSALQESTLDAPALRRLSIAADMLTDSWLTKRRWTRNVKVDEILQDLTDLDPGITMAHSSRYDFAASRLIRGEIIRQSLTDENLEFNEKLQTGLKVQWQDAAYALNTVNSHTDGIKAPETKDTLIAMIESLETAFLKTDALTEPSKKAEAKGLLHELLWMLDGYMLRASSNRHQGIAIYPANSREDAPIIGRPQARRGWDYIVGSAGSHTKIQLKSSPRSKVIYHPDIKVAAENNLLDFNARRLSLKLVSYKRIIENQFQDTAETTRVLNKYVLPTVRGEVTAYTRLDDEQTASLVANLARAANDLLRDHHPTMNRADRRRVIRELGRRTKE